MIGAGALRDRYDVAVVGAGPAGLAAASLVCAGRSRLRAVRRSASSRRSDLSRRHQLAVARNAVLGDDYWRGEALVRARACERCALRRRRDGMGLAAPERARGFGRRQQRGKFALPVSFWRPARSSGRFPIPGWTLPGVMTAGGAQILLKSSALVPAGTDCAGGLRAAALAAGLAISQCRCAARCAFSTRPRRRIGAGRSARCRNLRPPLLGEGVAAHARPSAARCAS